MRAGLSRSVVAATTPEHRSLSIRTGSSSSAAKVHKGRSTSVTVPLERSGRGLSSSNGTETTARRIWEHVYSENVTVYDVAVGAEDAIYVTGTYGGVADFGGLSLTSATGDLFVAKYTADGGLIWVSGLGAQSDAMGMAIAVDGFDNVYVVANSGVGSFTFADASHVSRSNITQGTKKAAAENRFHVAHA